MEWAIEHVKTYGKPVAATICVGPNGDEDGVSLGKDYSIMDYLTNVSKLHCQRGLFIH